MNICSYDPQDQQTDIITGITRTTALPIGAKWCRGRKKLFFGGYNLYAVEDEAAALIETYDTEREARRARNMIVGALINGAEYVFV